MLEVKRIIRKRDFEMLTTGFADPSRRIVRQRRHSIMHEQRYMEVIEYLGEEDDRPHLTLLNVQLAEDGTHVLPDAFGGAERVTGDPNFSALQLSLARAE